MTSEKGGITVVICTYNGRARLLPTLSSIINQEFHPSLFELIVVDNASTDDTRELCELILSNAAIHWRIVEEPNPGLNHARLKGIAEAKFDIVLFCDDDNSLSLDYLQIAFELFKNNPRIGVLGGCGVPAFEGDKPEWFDQYSHSFAVGPQSSSDGKVKEIPAELYGAGTFFNKAPLLYFFKKGLSTLTSDRKGNSLVSGGDVEYCYLVQLAGYEVWYDHRLTFTHYIPASRLQWNYYLKLKQGIALGSASLFPYACLFKDREMGLIRFGMNWLSNLMKYTLLFLKHTFKFVFISYTIRRESELAISILRSKAMSYWGNGIKPFQHFIYLRKLL